MKKLIVISVFLAVFGVAASAFACTNCSKENNASLQQQLNVNVPTVVSLILDDHYSHSATAGETKNLKAWTINLETPVRTYKSNDCYVIPNWVGIDTSFWDFVGTTPDFSTLYKASNPGVRGYPAVVVNGDSIETWGTAWSSSDKYAGENATHASARAKGNILCVNSFAVEKYTNCPSASFAVSVQSNADTPKQGFGTLYIKDDYHYNGIATMHSSGWQTFNSAPHRQVYTPLLKSVKPGAFIDDTITQMLWLRDSQPGTYSLVTTYTLGSALLKGEE